MYAGFMTHVVEPLFIEWDRFARSHHSRSMLANLRFNRAVWQNSATKHPKRHTHTSALSRDYNGTRLCDINISRRHSLPDSLSAASDDGRRHSLPMAECGRGGTAVNQLDALIECSPTYDSCLRDNQFHFEPTNTRRRRSLNNFLSHRRSYFMTSSTRKRSRSLVSSLSTLFHAQAIGDVTSSKQRNIAVTASKLTPHAITVFFVLQSFAFVRILSSQLTLIYLIYAI
jgi:hypothetical protein